MKRTSAVFFQMFIVLLGIGALVFMLWEPHLEGRNAQATLFQIYFNDPFLAFAYAASLPFFVGLYQIFNVLGFAGQTRLISPEAVAALRTLKHCAMATLGFSLVGEVFIFLGESDDRAGGVFIGGLIAAGSIVTAIAAARLERSLAYRLNVR